MLAVVTVPACHRQPWNSTCFLEIEWEIRISVFKQSLREVWAWLASLVLVSIGEWCGWWTFCAVTVGKNMCRVEVCVFIIVTIVSIVVPAAYERAKVHAIVCLVDKAISDWCKDQIRCRMFYDVLFSLPLPLIAIDFLEECNSVQRCFWAILGGIPESFRISSVLHKDDFLTNFFMLIISFDFCFPNFLDSACINES